MIVDHFRNGFLPGFSTFDPRASFITVGDSEAYLRQRRSRALHAIALVVAPKVQLPAVNEQAMGDLQKTGGMYDTFLYQQGWDDFCWINQGIMYISSIYTCH
jgi:hypothetical protein